MERRSESQQSQSSFKNVQSASNGTIMQCPTLEIVGQTQPREESRGQQRMGKQQHRFVQRCSNRSLNFLQVIGLFVYGSVLIASLQAAVFHGSTSEKASILSTSPPLFTGAAAMAVDRVESPRALDSHASSQALFAAVVRSADVGSNERRMEEQSAAESRRDGLPSSFLRGKPQQPSRVTKPSSDIASVPVQRWGHSVTYLEDANVAFFIGGVVPSGQNESALTSAVYALDLNVNTTQEWTRLPSTNLAAHAFAARAVAYNSNGTVERIIVIGGSSSNCSANATQAFTWQIGDSWKDGNWSAVKMDYPEFVPSRRRGMEAVQVPVQVGQSGLEAKQLVKEGGVSYMLLGGIADESTCSNSSTLYPDVDIWTMGASLKGASKVIQANSTKRMDTRTLILSSNMTSVSLADYSSVVIPGNGTQSDRILMLGGVNEEGELASFERPWIYNISSGLWSKLDTTNSTGKKSDIPSGRVGHTATLTSNGTVIVYGGFTSLGSMRQPKSDVHVLDLSVEPAVWSRVNTSGSPSRAFHTAFMTGDFLVVGFGMSGNATSYANSTNATIDMSRILPSKRATNDTTYQPVQVMDTANKQGWTWSNSIREALAIRPTTASKAARVAAKATANRAAVVSATSTSAAATITAPLFPTVSAPSSARSQSTARATSKVTVSSASRASAQRAATRSSASASSSTASSSSSSTFTNPFTSSQPSATATSTSSSGSGMTQSTRNTAVIASILGAAALAASIGGLYAAHKRREASRRDNDDNLYGNDRYERFSDAAPGPPVSSLWLNQPATWAGNASKGLKDKANLASVALLNRGKDLTPREHGSPAMGETYTSPFPVMSTRAANYDMLNDVQGLRDLPASSRLSIRRNQLREQEAIRNKLRQQEKRASMGYFPNEMSPYHGSNGGDAYDEEQAQRTDRRRTVGAEAFHNFLRSPAVPQPAVTRNGSSESLGSVGGASHFSYPYLSAMNRPTIHFGGAAGEDYSNNSSPHSMHQAQMGPPPASPSYILDSQANKASLLTDHHQAGFPFRSLIDGHGSDSGSRGPSVDSTNGAIASHHEQALAAVAARRESRRPSTMMMMQATQISLPSSNEDDSPTLPSADYLSPASSSLQHQQQQSDRRSSRHSTLRVVNSDGH